MRKGQLLFGLGIGGIALYFLLRKQKETEASAAASSIVTGPVNFVTNPVADPSTTGSQPSTQYVRPDVGASALKGAATGAAIGGTVGTAIPVIGTAIGTAVGAAVGAIGGALFAAFSSRPLDPVTQILIMEMPYGYTGVDNVPWGAADMRIYALDRYGYIWPLAGSNANTCGYSWREVILVNSVVFSMLQKGDTEICDRKQIEPMPRPADAATLRGAFGNDIRFKLGASNDFHGPWEADANVPPIAGTPAAWASIAGSYLPTKVSSPGEF